MLVKPPKPLINATVNFTVRYYLMAKLNDEASLTTPQDFCKLVLAFWLGSNHLLTKLKKYPYFKQCSAYLYFGYYCFLALDKYSSAMDIDSADYKELKRITQALLLYFNNNSIFLIEAPKTLFATFLALIKQMNMQEGSLNFEMMKKVQKACVIELSRAFRTVDPTIKPEPNALVTWVRNDITRRFVPWNLGVLFTQVVTSNLKPHLFFLDGDFSEDYSWRKLILPAKDGTLLEGLQVERKGIKSSVIVLVLAGHFQAEDKYFSEVNVSTTDSKVNTTRYQHNYSKFQEVFNPASVVFINHRNYSNRAIRYANRIQQLGEDVACFASFFAAQNMAVVLYGMCGGAYQALNAATLLQQEKNPFKIILDRFPKTYSQFFELKNLMRIYRIAPHYLIHQTTFPQQEYLKLILLGVLLSNIRAILVLMVLSLREKEDFTATLAQIPKKNVLVLQATKENYSLSKRYVQTDMIVHPDADPHLNLRIKCISILQDLARCCQMLACNAIFSESLEQLFLQLKICFERGVILIENEQLKFKFPVYGTADLHPIPLFNLCPQNEQSLNGFLQSFFTKPPESCRNLVNLLPILSESTLRVILSSISPRVRQSIELPRFAHHLTKMLSIINENRHFIIEVMDRLMAGKQANCNELLTKLLQSKIFQEYNGFVFTRNQLTHASPDCR